MYLRDPAFLGSKPLTLRKGPSINESFKYDLPLSLKFSLMSETKAGVLDAVCTDRRSWLWKLEGF